MDFHRLNLGWIGQGNLIDTTVTIVGLWNIKRTNMNALLKHGSVLGLTFLAAIVGLAAETPPALKNPKSMCDGKTLAGW